MKFSLPYLLIGVLLLAIMAAAIWPLLLDQHATYSVTSGKTSGAGPSGGVRAAESFRATGHPTFICSTAWSDQIPYLNGNNLPYVVVIHHEPDTEFSFKSKATIDETVSTLTEFSVNNLSFSVEHKLVRDFHDPPNPPIVTEQLLLNGEELSIDKGRLIEIELENRKFTTRQHNVGSLDGSVFRGRYSNDRDRVKPVLTWWRELRESIGPQQPGG